MNGTVLIVDGDPWQRETLAAALAYEGWHAEHTGDAAGAMALLAEHCIQIVLIDPTFPATGGWETIEKLVLQRPHLPVIVLAPADEPPGSHSSKGTSEVLEKPLDFSALLRAIERALSSPAETFVIPCLDPHLQPPRSSP